MKISRNSFKQLTTGDSSTKSLAIQSTGACVYNAAANQPDPWLKLAPKAKVSADLSLAKVPKTDRERSIQKRIDNLRDEREQTANDPTKQKRSEAIGREIQILSRELEHPAEFRSSSKTETLYPYGAVAALVVSSIIMFILIVMILARVGRSDSGKLPLTDHQKFLKDVASLKADGYEVTEYFRLNKGEVYATTFTNSVRFQVVASGAYTVLTPNDTSGPTDVNRHQTLDVGKNKTDYYFSLRAKEDNTEFVMMEKLYDGASNPISLLFKYIDKVFNSLKMAIGSVLLIALFTGIFGIAILQIILVRRLYLRKKK